MEDQWIYYYRAVDQHGHTADFYFPEKKDPNAAHQFFEQAIHHLHDFPLSVTFST